jgi:hypothetical protein
VKTFEPPATIPAEMRALVPAQIDRYRAGLVPATPRSTLGMLARLSVHFPDQRSKEEWELLHQDYADALAEIPADIVAEAIRRYLLRARFYPKISELMAEIEPLMVDRRNELHALVKLSSVETPEERAERMERERKASEAKRLAEIEALCEAKPHLRPYYKWAATFRRHMDMCAWLGWLEEQSKSQSAEQIEAWHQQLADEQASSVWAADFNALHRLKAIGWEAGNQQPAGPARGERS